MAQANGIGTQDGPGAGGDHNVTYQPVAFSEQELRRLIFQRRLLTAGEYVLDTAQEWPLVYVQG